MSLLWNLNLALYRCTARGEEAREVPDGQVRGAPDGAHQEAAQGGDVDLRPAAGALRDRGQQQFLATLFVSHILRYSKRTKVCRFMLPTHVALQQSSA